MKEEIVDFIEEMKLQKYCLYDIRIKCLDMYKECENCPFNPENERLVKIK